MEISKTSGKSYSLMDVVAIRDPKQQRLYIKHGAKVVDLFYDDIIVYVFNKADTFDLYKKWKERTFD